MPKLYEIKFSILMLSRDGKEPSRDSIQKIAEEFARMPGAVRVMAATMELILSKPTKPQNQKRPQ